MREVLVLGVMASLSGPRVERGSLTRPAGSLHVRTGPEPQGSAPAGGTSAAEGYPFGA